MGLYVDFNNNLSLPQEIAINTFNNALSINEEYTNIYRIIKLGYERIMESESKSILINSINNDTLPRIKDFLKPKNKD